MVLWGGSVLGRQKVPPRFSKFRVSGGPSWAARRVCGRPHQGFTELPGPPRFHQGSTKVSVRLRKFRDLSGLLGRQKVLWKFPPSLL